VDEVENQVRDLIRRAPGNHVVGLVDYGPARAWDAAREKVARLGRRRLGARRGDHGGAGLSQTSREPAA
jgi:hypothetical protein